MINYYFDAGCCAMFLFNIEELKFATKRVNAYSIYEIPIEE